MQSPALIKYKLYICKEHGSLIGTNQFIWKCQNTSIVWPVFIMQTPHHPILSSVYFGIHTYKNHDGGQLDEKDEVSPVWKFIFIRKLSIGSF